MKALELMRERPDFVQSVRSIVVLRLFALSLIAYSCSSDNKSLGIGVFHFALNKEETLTLYSEAELLNREFTVTAKFKAC